jgi:uracil-DNA glycosylase family 4
MPRADHTLRQLHNEIIRCTLCPRLVEWRGAVATEKVARYRAWDYWGKPVPGFGDPKAGLLIIGLAPAAHGANRTGRMFTGDRSGDWLYRALHKAGFASQPLSLSADDGLHLTNCYITASARCAPPQNKPLPGELLNCRPYLLEELRLLGNVRVVIGLGKIGCDTAVDAFRAAGRTGMKGRIRFGHGAEAALNDRVTLIASFHPSQQNTFTRKLTEPMFDAVFRRAKALLRDRSQT